MSTEKEKLYHFVDYKGKKIVSKEGGKEIGTLEDIRVDPESLATAAIVTSKSSLLSRGIEAIPAEHIQVWGEDVILIDQADVLQPKSEFTDFDSWFSVADEIRGKSMVSMNGERIGKVHDVILNANGSLVGVQLEKSSLILEDIFGEESEEYETSWVPSTSIHVLGKDVILVDLENLPIGAEQQD